MRANPRSVSAAGAREEQMLQKSFCFRDNTCPMCPTISVTSWKVTHAASQLSSVTAHRFHRGLLRQHVMLNKSPMQQRKQLCEATLGFDVTKYDTSDQQTCTYQGCDYIKKFSDKVPKRWKESNNYGILSEYYSFYFSQKSTCNTSSLCDAFKSMSGFDGSKRAHILTFGWGVFDKLSSKCQG